MHSKKIEDILHTLHSDINTGLSKEDAKSRLNIYGENLLPRGKKTHWWNFIFRQFKSPLIYILLVAALITSWIALFGEGGHQESGSISEWVDTIVILLAVSVNVVVGFWQEFRSNTILEKLSLAVGTLALVIRGGKIYEIDARELVPGDIIVLKVGAKVPADARILDSHNLEAEEAALTGESAPVGKSEGVIEEDTPLADRHNMVYMGTTVARGEGRMVVVGTGVKTELGKIALLTERAEDEPTPLQVRMARLGRFLALTIGAIAGLIFVLGILQKLPAIVMFKTAIAVAVAAIPEGLPAAISIVLAVAAQRILGEKGVIKRLVAAETLGSARVICSDKTGTLTEGKMEVEQFIAEGNDERFREALALANEAIVEEIEGGGLVVRGEVTDKAKLEAYFSAGGNIENLLVRYPRLSLLPFDPSRKYLASLHTASVEELKAKSKAKGALQLFVSGAPETIIAKSKNMLGAGGQTARLTQKRRDELQNTYEQLASKGYRMIAAAEKTIARTSRTETDLEDDKVRGPLVNDLTFVGLAAIRDPIREDVPYSIAVAREAGIRIMMLTGDHMLTALAIGKELGFKTEGRAAIEGREIEQLSEKDLVERLAEVEIGARVNPEHKMRIIDALQSRGEVVAMTGDGVNDAPALKAADIGVALNAGTDVSKAASDLILLNNSFSIIVSAIRQGRIAFDNIKKVTVFLLAGSFSELILILTPLIAPLFLREGIPLPLTAVQILWTNLVEDSLPNVALAFEPGEEDIMKRPPLARNQSVLDIEAKTIIFAVGIFTDLLLVALFLWLHFKTSLTLEQIRTFIFAALGFDTFFYVFSIKSLRRPIWEYRLTGNPYLVVAVLLGILVMLSAIYMPPLQLLLGTTAFPFAGWAVILGIGIIEILGVEAAKWWFFGRKGGKI